jgi:uracil phosphoribosyltransferase
VILCSAQLFYSKLPPSIATQNVVLCDPMLATGGSAITAIECILAKGVPEEKIIFINLVSCPEGLAAIYKAHPKILVVCACVDRELNEK